MIYIFDLDGTLCSDSSGQYDMALPIQERIDKVNDLFSEGNRIVIFTARGMGSSEGNQNLAKEKWMDFTSEQLKKWGLNYHELILGKPSGDLYIDDKGISDNHFFINLNK
jgi:hypothetical protein